MQTIVRFSLSSLFLHFLFYSHSFEKYSFHSDAATAYSFPFFYARCTFSVWVLFYIYVHLKNFIYYSPLPQSDKEAEKTSKRTSTWVAGKQLSDTLRIDGWLVAPLADFRKADSTVFHSK